MGNNRHMTNKEIKNYMKTKINITMKSYLLFSLLFLLTPFYSFGSHGYNLSGTSPGIVPDDGNYQAGAGFIIEERMKDMNYRMSWFAPDIEETPAIAGWMKDINYWVSRSATDIEETPAIAGWMTDINYWVSRSATDIEETPAIAGWMTDINYWNIPMAIDEEILEEVASGIEPWMADPCRWDTGGIDYAGKNQKSRDTKLCMNDWQEDPARLVKDS
jgi:hypothetical protein